MIDINDFIQEVECIYKDEKYTVRDNGAIFRHPRDGKQPRKYDNLGLLASPTTKPGIWRLVQRVFISL